MRTSDEYRRKALECAEAADRVSDLNERLTLLEIAQAWLRLANHVTDDPPDAPPDTAAPRESTPPQPSDQSSEP